MQKGSGANPALAKAEPVSRLGPSGFDPGEGTKKTKSRKRGFDRSSVAGICAKRGFREPKPNGDDRNRTLTVWVSKGDLETIDTAAKRNGLSRANFSAMCIVAGYQALRDEGQMV